MLPRAFVVSDQRERIPALAVPLFIGGLYDVVYNRIRSGDEESLTALEPDLVEIALRLLRPPD